MYVYRIAFTESRYIGMKYIGCNNDRPPVETSFRGRHEGTELTEKKKKKTSIFRDHVCSIHRPVRNSNLDLNLLDGGLTGICTRRRIPVFKAKCTKALTWETGQGSEVDSVADERKGGAAEDETGMSHLPFPDFSPFFRNIPEL